MRRILLGLSVAALMAAMMVTMAMPAFAAKPNSFVIECENQESGEFQTSSTSGRGFGQDNKGIREEGFKGNECKRSVSEVQPEEPPVDL